jgi:single-strand DNA-binding protein
MSDHVTILGNLTTDPAIHHGQADRPVARLRVAVNRARFDRDSGEWVTVPPVFHTVVAFGALAENIAGSALSRGDAVVVVGGFADDSYTSEGGTTQERIQVIARAVGGPDPVRHHCAAHSPRRDATGRDGARPAMVEST